MASIGALDKSTKVFPTAGASAPANDLVMIVKTIFHVLFFGCTSLPVGLWPGQERANLNDVLARELATFAIYAPLDLDKRFAA